MSGSRFRVICRYGPRKWGTVITDSHQPFVRLPAVSVNIMYNYVGLYSFSGKKQKFNNIQMLFWCANIKEKKQQHHAMVKEQAT